VADDKALRLRAEDAEDLAIISACLQDALIAVRDLAYDATARCFVLAANRFRWEGRGRGFERVHCAVAFDGVEGVAYRGFSRVEDDRILSLLAIRPKEAMAGATIDLEFAGGPTIRLVAAAIGCRVRDFGEPWPTAWQPAHGLDDTG
jgi:hypothetical protein